MVKPVDKLKERIEGNKVILVIGAGVSAYAANVDGWGSLLKKGLQFANDRYLGINEIIIFETILKDFKFLEAGEMLKKILESPLLFSSWLKEVFSDIEATDISLHKAIESLGCNSILTTNYDTLLTDIPQFTKYKILTHEDYQEALRLIKVKKHEFVMHIHGIYTEPKTVILAQSDYDRLNENKGYKRFLEKIIHDYHFLFIGCSNEGVMDEDFLPVFNFMKEWFSDSTNDHYILIQQKEIEKGNHISLLRECNVTPIVYGDKYSDLPKFINEINPNKEKFKNKLLLYQKTLETEINSLNSQEDINRFIDKNSNMYTSYDIEKGNVLLQALEKYNLINKNKKSQLINIQNTIQAILPIDKIEKCIKLWDSNMFNPLPLCNQEFFITAILAYNSLKIIPKNMIDDIGRSKQSRVFHYGFYKGNFNSFILEAEHALLTNIVLKDKYKNDSYFFENLKRVMTSAQGFLELDPNIIFNEIEEAIKCSDIPNNIVCINSGESLDLYDYLQEKKIASLPLDSTFNYFNTHIIKDNGKIKIISACSQYAFSWCPTEDLFINIFFEPENASIEDLSVSETDDSFTIVIRNKTKIYYFENFLEINKNFPNAVRVDQLKIIDKNLLAVNNYYDSQNIIKIFNEDNEQQTLLTKQDLINELLKDPELKIKIDRILEEDIYIYGSGKIEDSIKNFQIFSIKKSENEFILLSTLSYKNGCSLLFYCSIKDNKINIEKVILGSYATSLSLDTLHTDKEIIIACSYLNTAGNETIFELITLDNNKNIINRFPFEKRNKTYQIQDTCNIIIINKNEIIINIEYRELYRINHLHTPPIKRIPISTNIKELVFFEN